MSYRHSRARRAFQLQISQSLTELMPLYRHARSYGGGESRLLAAYYVFAFAQFEQYVKSLVEDLIAAIVHASPALDRVPDLMLGYILHKSENLGRGYRKFGFAEDEGALLESVAAAARKVAQWGQASQLQTQLETASFLEKKKYPSPKNLPQLFRRLGVRAIWPVINSAGKMNGELMLTSLNDLRTGIAHEGRVPPGFSLSDFKGRIDQMERFVAALDRGISKYYCGVVMPRSVWNSQMS
ncbi:hypothetical protein FIV34_01845 [Luteibacter pinisoli]|uniref:RiboL-PSP-HEPN domain-containing protein n=1 Tax=Luteibacter pinisoli TaxID=2589080 RepID=A0A4Y5YYZ7_9GAMM|nr:HEPN domain-containing protein [Luteibacter pinisoli]QDE38024.1 hypothetical protein FIV34_01845 [Luteibacter pinisoli]